MSRLKGLQRKGSFIMLMKNIQKRAYNKLFWKNRTPEDERKTQEIQIKEIQRRFEKQLDF